MDKQTYSVVEVAKIIGVSRDTIYKLINEKKLHALRPGRKVLIPKWAVEVYLGKPAESVA